MDLDDQLAALAAGELDDDTARALRARAASEPAVARRLGRHQQLQDLLTGWEAPALSDAAVTRLDAAVDDALAALSEEPLAGRPTPTGPLTAGDEAPAAAPGSGGGVADLAAARARRERRWALPAWAPGAAVAAALLAVVGTGVLAGGGLVGSSDDAADTLADAPASDEAAESAVTEESVELDAAAGDTAADDAAETGPAGPGSVDLAAGELLTLLDDAEPSDQAAADGADADVAVTAGACITEALERDTAGVDGREVWRTARGSYAGRDAVFVVVRSPADEAGDRYEVLAYDPDDCTLLDRDTATR